MNVNPVQWTEAIGHARQTCARIYRGGGNPLEAMRFFGLSTKTVRVSDWDQAIERIAWSLCGARR
jgi:hypothetical protein